MMRRRIMGLALIALVVPFPALALDGGGTAPSYAPGTLTVSASLDSCGLGGSQIMCKIDAGWNSLEGAENYTVSVTSADGSVIDLGSTTGQGTSVWVPYVGSGTYSVSVTAWGTPPDEEEVDAPEVIARSTSGEASGVSKAPPEGADSADARDAADLTPATDEPVVPDVLEPADPRDEEPVCDEPPAEEPPAEPAPDTEAEPEGDERSAEDLAEPEVVDTIPVDDDCTP